MEKVTFPPNAVFSIRGYVQHAGREWHGKCCLWYHLYLVREDVQLKDAIAFAYRNKLCIARNRDIEVGGIDKDNAVVLERNMKDPRSENDEQVQVGAVSKDD